MSGCIKHEDKQEKKKKQLYNWNFMEQKKTFYVVSSAEHKDHKVIAAEPIYKWVSKLQLCNDS